MGPSCIPVNDGLQFEKAIPAFRQADYAPFITAEVADKKASAKSKLLALGLTEAEVAALVG